MAGPWHQTKSSETKHSELKKVEIFRRLFETSDSLKSTYVESIVINDNDHVLRPYFPS